MRIINRLFSPKRASRLKRPLFFKKVSGRPQWNCDTRLWVKAQLEKDIHSFLEEQEMPLDFWDSFKPTSP
jgi:hypothetical protein